MSVFSPPSATVAFEEEEELRFEPGVRVTFADGAEAVATPGGGGGGGGEGGGEGGGGVGGGGGMWGGGGGFR